MCIIIIGFYNIDFKKLLFLILRFLYYKNAYLQINYRFFGRRNLIITLKFLFSFLKFFYYKNII